MGFKNGAFGWLVLVGYSGRQVYGRDPSCLEVESEHEGRGLQLVQQNITSPLELVIFQLILRTNIIY